jgi:hypothetical protein
MFDLSRYELMCELTPDGGKLRPSWDRAFWAKKVLSKPRSVVYVITIGDEVYKIGMTDCNVSMIINGYCKSDFLRDRAAHREVLAAAVAAGVPVRFHGYLVEMPPVAVTLPSGETAQVRPRCGGELERDALRAYEAAHGELPRGNHFERAPKGRRAN